MAIGWRNLMSDRNAKLQDSLASRSREMMCVNFMYIPTFKPDNFHCWISDAIPVREEKHDPTVVFLDGPDFKYSNYSLANTLLPPISAWELGCCHSFHFRHLKELHSAQQLSLTPAAKGG